MKNYAIAQIKGKQYQVQEGKTLLVDRLDDQAGKKIKLDEVLLIVPNKGQPTLGNPYIKNAHIKAKIVDHIKGKKLRILRFKAKSRYRRRLGYRHQYTKLQIEKIVAPK